jgi:tRNA1(Val) A37 N6-methylase TrmN6
MTSSEKSSDHIKEVTSDKIFNDSTFIDQFKNGYRFNSDSMILSWFIFKILSGKDLPTSIEAGSGTGVVPIVLNCHGFRSRTYCFEVQKNLFRLLRQNIENNGLSDTLTPINDSFLNSSMLFTKKCDLVYTNPPYFPVDAGRHSPNSEKAKARHEFFGSLNDFLLSASKILKDKGHFVFVYPVSRIQFGLSSATKAGFSLRHLYLYQENPSVSPSLFTAHLILSNSEAAPKTELITMRDHDGEYTSVGREIMYDKA